MSLLTRSSGIAVAMALLFLAAPVHAVEYRLLVASVVETSFTSFVSRDELVYGASGPGLQRLETALTKGDIDWGTMPPGRPLTSVPDRVARAWAGVGVRSDILRGGVDTGRWDEVRWDGKPGERSIWLIKATGNPRPQSVQRLTLEGGASPVRQYLPFTYTGSARLAVLQMPQPLITFAENQGNVWDRWVAKGLDLGQGIGAVVAFSPNALNPDLVYLVVQQGERPATYRAVISWSDADIDRESPNSKRIQHSGHH
ncbi:MAG TPA: hypothetical protein VMI34_20125 [Candidatus Bathyarchaeia archaeon]|nr:hypothetical protein [Candidatus Bathyarchaeia archaeon]